MTNPKLKIRKRFNWLTFLERAIKKEPSENMQRKALYLAQEWPTCACGHLCKDIPRGHDGSPMDPSLVALGSLFFCHVDGGNWTLALETFHAIEKRTAELLSVDRK